MALQPICVLTPRESPPDPISRSPYDCLLVPRPEGANDEADHDDALDPRAARALSVNSDHSVHQEAPFGGFKKSGLGRELGMHAMAAYTEVKNVYFSSD